ncbi:hypothetical protein NZ698_00575 [Chryseobacterium sp. PBS4-4]|uniref:Baseplate structural protein Gp10 C-terminal domain-containing protein n=1 Tax=Chryseobacterium edaphi TaxID=2976532 RepID=A0ABT2W107_9FLAO|nr:hypothetical protein [Chryseobacterium edaphi]MCU7615675.1 hypothetical protein [Chryseobacterium edaphi]
MQTDGVPLTADLMDQIQEAYAIFNVIGSVAGNFTILSGCEINGTLVNPGIVVINGDVLFFEGGTVNQNVFIHQEDILKTFKNQQAKVLIEKRTVKFGNASTVYNWSEFVKIDTLKKIKEDLALKADKSELDLVKSRLDIVELKTAPIINGGVIWAFGRPVNEIPIGWKEATDYAGKTIVGLDPNDPMFSTLGANVGSKTHTLTKEELPNINGDFLTITGNGYNGSGNGFITVQSGFAAYILGSNNGQFQHKTLRLNFGNNQPHNNIQPSRIANFIEPNFQ